MSIYMRLMSPDSYAALESLCIKRDWCDIYVYMDPEQVAWLAFKLELVPDTEENFPRGKWATIQHLQSMLREEAKQSETLGVEKP